MKAERTAIALRPAEQAPLPSTRTIDGLPPVTIVPVAARSIGPLPSITVLLDGTVGFVPDQTVGVDCPRACWASPLWWLPVFDGAGRA